MTEKSDHQNEPSKASKWGKGKTDPDSWWKKGCPSPNPKGRPKGSKNQKTLYHEAVQEIITCSINGQKKTMTKQELKYHQLAQQAASGDMKAVKITLDLDAKFDPVEATPPTPQETEADLDTLEALVALMQKFKPFDPQDDGDG